jgi:hypothetical protein
MHKGSKGIIIDLKIGAKNIFVATMGVPKEKRTR